MTNELNSLWDRLQKDIRRIYTQSPVRFDESAERQFFEYLDLNELGLAYEELCDLMKEKGCSIGAELYAVIFSTGTEMGLTPDTWERLKPLVR